MTDLNPISAEVKERYRHLRPYLLPMLYSLVAIVGVILISEPLKDVLHTINSDIYINSILHPYLSVADHSIINRDFFYSNGDHRLIGISAFHIVPAMLFPDNPWAVYFWGALLRSAVLICLMTYICRAFNAGIMLTFAIIMFIGIPTGFQYLEHVHAQGSYVFTHYLIPIVILAAALHFKVLEMGVGSSEPQNLTEMRRPVVVLSICIILALILNAPRGLVTIVVPLVGAYCMTILLCRIPIRKGTIKPLAFLIVAALIGLLCYSVLKSNLTYTYGAAKPFSLKNWPGQIGVLKEMADAWSKLTHWNFPHSRLHNLRSLAGIALLIYVFCRGVLALWKRTDRADVFVTLYTGAVVATLALAFNFTNITATPRYILPILIMFMMCLIVLSQNKIWLEKLAVAACVSVFPMSAYLAMPMTGRVVQKASVQNEALFSYLRENDVSHGISTWRTLGLLNLNFGEANFAPTAFGPDGTLTSTPFGTSFYLRDFQEQHRTALVFSKKHPRDSVALDSLEAVLFSNNLNLLKTQDFELGRGVTRVVIIEGDIRKLQSLPEGGTDKIYTPINENIRLVGNAVRTVGEECSAALQIKGDQGSFEYKQSAIMLYENSTYKFEINFDGRHPENVGALNVILADRTRSIVKSIPYLSEGLEIEIKTPGIYSLWLSSSNPDEDYKICGSTLSK